jgi:protein required for attachment to host cells
VAPAGRLRQSISKEVAKRVRQEINQDLSTVKA